MANLSICSQVLAAEKFNEDFRPALLNKVLRDKK